MFYLQTQDNPIFKSGRQWNYPQANMPPSFLFFFWGGGGGSLFFLIQWEGLEIPKWDTLQNARLSKCKQKAGLVLSIGLLSRWFFYASSLTSIWDGCVSHCVHQTKCCDLAVYFKITATEQPWIKVWWKNTDKSESLRAFLSDGADVT